MARILSSRFRPRPRRGSALFTAVIFTTIAAATTMGVVSLGAFHYRKQAIRQHYSVAYYDAENALLEAAQRVGENGNGALGKTQIVSNSSVVTNNFLPTTPDPNLNALAVRVTADPGGNPSFYQITASATYANKLGRTRTLRATVQRNPPSEVFDYEYFLNNWGWWWGNTITGNGDNRSNWDFDFRYNPTLNGHAYAAGDVEENMSPINVFGGTVPFAGWANADPVTYAHAGSSRVKMPNLKDLSYYESKATGTIKQGAATLVSGIQGDNEVKTGIYLNGTAANPIKITGTVVIRGDVVITGVVTGQGTLYAGGSIYMAGNVTYANGPTFTTASGSTPQARITAQDTWAANNTSKDMIAFASRGSLLAGQVNSSAWKSYVFDAGTYGLGNIREDNLGADGIRGTPDDNVKYKDTNGDGVADSSAYDVDEDGTIRSSNYNYSNDFQMTSTRANNIQGYPTETNGSMKDYNSVATDQINKIEGIYYTNHCFGHWSAKGPETFNGILISHDEAWVFTNAATMNYDWRAHSRNRDDPNSIVDLDLPIARKVKFITRAEINNLTPATI